LNSSRFILDKGLWCIRAIDLFSPTSEFEWLQLVKL
jgi:hypothetical protein